MLFRGEEDGIAASLAAVSASRCRSARGPRGLANIDARVMSSQAPPLAAQPAPRSDRVQQSVGSRQIAAIATIILLGPVLVVLALRLPLVNQLDYADAWFYSAYAWAPKHQFEVFGWNYFAARFPAVLAIGVFKRVFGVGGGYVLLRYLLAAGCGVSIYACVRRFASVPVALAAAALLYLQPFFSRMLLWDYAGFAEVSAALIGIALWYWSDSRRLAWTLLPGAALAAAAFANAAIGTALFVFIVIETLAALRQGRQAVIHYGARLLALAASAAAVFLVGYLGYVAILGGFDPYNLLRPTIEFVSENGKNSAPYKLPTRRWLLHEPRLWMPVITSVALAALLGRRILGVDITARIAQLCVGYTAFLWVYRFSVTSSIVETWWAYSAVVIVTAPAVGVLLHALDRRSPARVRWAAAGVAAFGLTAVLIRNLSGPAGSLYHALANHEALLIALLAAGVASAALIGSRVVLVRTGSFTAFAVILAVMSYAPSALDGRGTTGIFVTDASRDWKAYRAGERFLNVVQDYDNPSHRVFLWYPGTLGYVSMTWADLPQEADTLNEVGVAESLYRLTPLARARVEQPQVGYVMVLSPRPAELATGLNVLARSGFTGAVVRHGALAEGGLDFAVLALQKK
jgi:hypothetical protein